jgi:hypothetical protein
MGSPVLGFFEPIKARSVPESIIANKSNDLSIVVDSTLGGL